jgi:Ca2+-binding EF-hand superfamily protein
LKRCDAATGFSVDDAKRIFLEYDKNRDEVLDRKEADAFFKDYCKAKKIKPNRAEIDRLFRMFDTDGDGTISWNELNRLAMPGLRKHKSTELKQNTERQTSGPSVSVDTKQDDAALGEVFAEFATDPDWPDHITGAGLEDFIGRLGFAGDPEANPLTLFTFYTVKASTPGEVSREEFNLGFRGLSNVEDITTKLRSEHKRIKSNAVEHRQWYSWCFDFLLDTDAGASVLDMDAALEAFEVLNHRELNEEWLAFLKTRISDAEEPLEHIDRDVFSEYYDFVTKCNPDLSNVDAVDNGALPSLIDEFLGHMEDKLSAGA